MKNTKHVPGDAREVLTQQAEFYLHEAEFIRECRAEYTAVIARYDREIAACEALARKLIVAAALVSGAPQSAASPGG